MKFERIYMGSHTNKKADSTDYVDYYKAENGMIIQVIEFLNTGGKFYKVFDDERDMNTYYPFGDKMHWCFERLKDAKDYVMAR